MKINEDDLKEDLIRVYHIIGKFPSELDYKNYGKYNKNTYISRRPWNVWAEECGLNLNRITNSNSNKVSNEDLINNLKQIQETLGRTPKKDDLKLSMGSKYSINAYNRAFGNLANALLSANMRPNQIRGLLKEDYITDLQRVYKMLGHTPSVDEFDKNHQTCSWVTIYNAFGSWTKALKAANIPIEINHNVSQQDVLKALQNWYEKNNKDTNCLEYWKIRKAKERKEFPYSTNTVRNKFKLPWEYIMRKIDPEYYTQDPFICRGSFEGDDGEIYLSSIEKEVADILFELKTSGKINTYEYEALVCQEKTWTCDFLIDKNLWLEIDGMKNSRKVPYNSGDNEKIKYYEENNLHYKIISYKNSDISKTLYKILGINNEM